MTGKDSPPAFGEWIDLVSGAMPSAGVALVEGGHLISAAHPAVLAFVDDVLARSATPAAATT